MRVRWNHYLAACVLCVTLLFTMGLDTIGAPGERPEPAQTTSIPTVETKFHKTQSEFVNEHILQLQLKKRRLPPVALKSGQNKPDPKQTEATTAENYEVTAHYLNVRSGADKSSRILHVVAQGSLLEVVGATDNGWLELKSGGYVHGKYAQRTGGSAKTKTSPPPKAEPTSPEKPTSLVKSESGLTEEHIAKILEGTALEGEGLEKAILEVENDYGINAYFTIAVMKLESGNGKSKIAKNKNNLFGLNASGSNPYKKALSFNTKGESVQKFGHLISKNYVDKGLTSIEKVAKKYCQANPKWPSLVKGIMKSDYKKVA